MGLKVFDFFLVLFFIFIFIYLIPRMVTSYLVHNGYSETAEAFARTTGQTFPEDINSIRNRQSRQNNKARRIFLFKIYQKKIQFFSFFSFF